MDDIHDITYQRFRDIVSEETTDMRTDIATMKSDINRLGSDVRILKSDMRDLKNETRRHGVMIESIQGDIKFILELLYDNLDVKKEVNDHEDRLTMVEKDQLLMKKAISPRSKRFRQRNA